MTAEDTTPDAPLPEDVSEVPEDAYEELPVEGDPTEDEAAEGAEPAPAAAKPVGAPEEETSPALAALAPLRAGHVLAVIAIALVALVIGRWSAPDAPVAPPPAEDAETVWTCSMHPQIRLPEPGQCPICAMDLIPLGGGADLGERVLELTPNAVALAEIETTPVQRRAVQREVRMVGLVDFDETRLNTITAWIPGRLDRLYVDYTGTLVRKGDHLVDIYSPELVVAQAELLQALERRASGGSDLLKETEERFIASAREKLRLWGLEPDQIAEIERTRKASDHVTIRAPIGGVVVEKDKSRGDYVKTGDRVFTIADLTQVWVKLDAHESDLQWVRYGQTVDFEAESYPGTVFRGRVVFIDPVVNKKTRTVKVRLNVDNSDQRLKPGMFVTAVLRSPLREGGRALDPSLVGRWICPMHGEAISDAPGSCGVCGMPLVTAESLHGPAAEEGEAPLVVPASAVLWTGVRSLLYVRLPGDVPLFEGRQVTLGPRAGPFYVVRSGVREGERVVTRGSFKIDSALQLEARPSMMLPGEGAGHEEQAPQPVDVDPRPPVEGAKDPPKPPPGLDPEVVRQRLRQQLDAVLGHYFALHRDLAGDKATGKEHAAALREAIQAIDAGDLRGSDERSWSARAKDLEAAVAAMASAKDIGAQRRAFEGLSIAVTKAVRRFGHLPERSVRRFHCPMALKRGADWLQEGEKTLNPYYGSKMLRCGGQEEVLKAKGAGQ